MSFLKNDFTGRCQGFRPSSCTQDAVLPPRRRPVRRRGARAAGEAGGWTGEAVPSASKRARACTGVHEWHERSSATNNAPAPNNLAVSRPSVSTYINTKGLLPKIERADRADTSRNA
jgi:hypothetical protein